MGGGQDPGRGQRQDRLRRHAAGRRRGQGCGLSNFVNVFQPEILLLGGGICKEGENLLAPLREIIARESYGIAGYAATKLGTCALGNDAGTIGAAFLWKIAE